MTVTYQEILGDLAAGDERIVVMTAENRAAIRGLPERLGPRFIDVGIAEQTLVGASAGLALRGRVPVVHALAAFLTMRAFEFIRTDVGVAGLPVKLVGYVPGILSDGNGPTHQALEDIALMRGIPGMRVFSPGDLDDLLIGLPVVLRDPHPWYIRYVDRPAVVEHDMHFEPGRAESLADGDDVALLVHGPLLREAHEAAVILRDRGLGVRLVNLRTIKPIDEHTILDAARATRLVATIEDHFRTGGLHSVVAEVLLQARRTAHVVSVALPDRWFTPALLPDAIDHAGLSGPRIADRIVHALNTQE